MKRQLYKATGIVILVFTTLFSNAQCDFESKMGNDGALNYFFKPVNFYFTKSIKLSGGVVTDKEYYYLLMQPYPFPAKTEGKKLKDNLEVVLSNERTYKLEFYYSDYDQNDSIFELLYMINKEDLNDFVNYEVKNVKINMGGEEGVRTYNFKLHKKAIQEQLNCFIENNKKGKSE